MCNIQSLVCSLSVVLSSLWISLAQTDKCGGRAVVIIAIPGGAGQASTTFEENLIDLIHHFDINDRNINVGLLLYGENSERILSPDMSMNRTQVITRISLMSKRQLYYSRTLGQSQDLVKGLRTMRQMFRGVPPGGRKIGVVFTEGLINSTRQEGRRISGAAARLKQSGVVMYNLGSNVSSEVGSVFESIGTDRCRLFSMGNFTDGLPAAIPYLASGICSEIDPSQTVTQGNCYPKTYAKEYPLPFTCPLELTNILLPDPNNCAYYYQCVPKVVRRPNISGNTRIGPEVPEVKYPPFEIRNEPIRRVCSGGTLFQNGYCNHASLVSC